MFLAFIKEHNLHENPVDMDEFADTREPLTPLCETPLCHGGWLAVMLNVKSHRTDIFTSFYRKGADAAAQYLGFEDKKALQLWAKCNPRLWGNTYGSKMFIEQRAFGLRHGDRLTLTMIAEHYEAVGKRCVAQSRYQ